MTNLSEKTPVEIDTEIVRINGLIAGQNSIIARGIQTIKTANLRIEQDAYDADQMPARIAKAEADIRAAELASMLLRDEVSPLHAEYLKRNWTRYFVVQNSNGHVHQDMHCSTCFASTQYGWMTQHSGLTAEEMIGIYGEDMCSECYPQAPVLAKGFRKSVADKQAVSCDGNGKYHSDVARDGWQRLCVAPQVTCKVCGERAAITKSGKIRRHDTPAERIRKEKAKNPEKVVIGRAVYKTRRAAEIALSQGCKVEGGKLIPSEHAQTIAGILSERDGVLVEVILKPFAKKVIARELRYTREAVKYLQSNLAYYPEGTPSHDDAAKLLVVREQEIEDLKAAQKSLRAA